MRIHRGWCVVLFLAVFGVTAPGADISGRWRAQFETHYTRDQAPREVGETTFTFQQNGEELTGTVSGTAMSESLIREGKVSGDKISFVVIRRFGGRERKMTYSGTLAGSEIKFETAIDGIGRGVRMIAKKVS